MLSALFALAVTAPPSGFVQVVLQKPERSLAEVAAFGDWLGLLEPAIDSRRIRHQLSGLIDPYDAAALRAIGVAVDKPAEIYVERGRSVAVVRVPLAAPAKTAAWIERFAATPGAGKWKGGAIVGSPSTHAIAVFSDGKAGYLQMGRAASLAGPPRGEDKNPAPITEIDAATDPRLAALRAIMAAPTAEPAKSDLTIRGAEPREFAADLKLSKARAELTVRVPLGVKDEAVVGAVFDAKRGPERVFSEELRKKAVARGVARLGKDAMVSSLKSPKLGPDLEVLVLEDGRVYAGIRAQKPLSAAELAELGVDIEARLRGPRVKVRQLKGAIVVAAHDDPDPSLGGGSEKLPLAITTRPDRVLAAIDGIGDRLGYGSLELLSAKMLAGPFLAATTKLDGELRVKPGALEIRVEADRKP